MPANRHFGAAVVLLAAACLVGPVPVAARDWPSQRTLQRDLTRYFAKQQPELKPAYVKKTSGCDKVEAEHLPAALRGRRRLCRLTADVYVEHGYRYDIYRACQVYYSGSKLLLVQPGELQRAWKEGGMPAPAAEEIVKLLQAAFQALEGIDSARVEVVELGKPRVHGDMYRLAVVSNVALTQQGKNRRLEGLLLFLESEGIEWRVAEQHLLPPAASPYR